MMAARASTLLIQLFTAAVGPAMLVRYLEVDQYAVWLIGLQSAGLLAIAEAGIGTTVIRLQGLFAHDPKQMQTVARAGVVIGWLAMAVATAMLALLVLFVPQIYPAIPAGMVNEARLVVVLVAIPAIVSIAIPASMGPLLYRQDAVRLVVATGIVQGLAGMTAVVLGATTGSLLILAATSSIFSTTVAVVCLMRVRHRARPFLPSARPSLRSMLFLLTEVRPQFILVVSSFALTGLDAIIVARYDFDAVVPYALAGSVITRVVALLTTVQDPLLAEYSRRRDDQRGSVVYLANHLRRAGLLVVCIFGILAVAYDPIFRLWIGRDLAGDAELYALVLSAASAVRLMGLPVYQWALGVGSQNRAVGVAVVEAVVNVSASWFLAQSFGAIGVAAGSVLGAIVGLAGHAFFTARGVSVVWPRRSIGLLSSGLVAHCCIIGGLVVVFRTANGGPVIFWSALLGCCYLIVVMSSSILHLKSRSSKGKGVPL